MDRSLGIKSLREHMEHDDLDGKESLIRKKSNLARTRIGKRTFIKEKGQWVDEEVSQMDAEKRKKLTEQIDAYSARYFELMRKHPELAKWMAKLGHGTVLLDGKVIQIVPLKKEAPAPSK